MSLVKTFSALGIASLLLLPQAGFAQQNTPRDGEWQALLPTASGKENDRPEASESLPELTRSAPEHLQTQADGRGDKSNVRVGSVLIETTAAIDHTIFDRAIEPLLGKEVTNDDLSKLAQEIAAIARSQGMVLADAHIPEQHIEMGMVRVVLSAGKIDEVRIEGSSNRALKRLLDPLVGDAVVQQELERRLVLANNIPQITVKRTELIQEGGRRILLVKVEERNKTSGRLVVDNFGSKSVGPLRARLSVEAVALLDDSDYMNVTFRTNPADPGELQAASTVYGIGLGNDGTRAEIVTAWSKSSIDPRFGFDRRDGASNYAAFSVNHPIRRSRTANLWAEAQFEYLKIEQDSLGTILQSDTVVTLSVGLSSSLKVGGGWLRTGTQIRQGLGMLGATDSGDMLSSRFDADGKFTSAKAWTSWSGKPLGDVTLRVAVSGQIASEPLLSSEEMGLGGAYLGRAFEFYERSGDQGIMGSLELGYEFSKPVNWIKRLQPFAFVDGGYVGNLQGGYGGGTLISAGGGLRADIGPVGVQFETALPVYLSGNGPDDSSPKVNVQVGIEF
jgi:hemolysin activation/secretion protein